MINVVDYDPSWPEKFTTLRDRYLDALVGVPIVAVEHVGSTAVAGLAAKPVIDIDIVVTAESVAPVSSVLETLGYQPLGEQGIPQRWAFRAPSEGLRTNTYVVVEGSLALRNHLAVRDTLRRDAGLLAAYADLKRQLAKDLDEIDAYVEAKSAVLTRILEKAGFDEDERTAIQAMNRFTRA